MSRRIVVALTGASGIAYGIKLLEHRALLRRAYGEVYVVYSENAARVARFEENMDLKDYLSRLDVDAVYFSQDVDAPLASSSRLVNTDMVIIPASLNTIAKVANGIQDNLITRVACNVLRLKGKLVVVLRETPLSIIDLSNLYRIAQAGAVVLPASPALYPKPRTVDEVVDFIVGKVLDVLGVDHNLYRRWDRT
ncbi:MAG: UbiX family flavin prenyltransferase [Desulfurococcaceae archaeon]